MPPNSAQNWWHPCEACRRSRWTLLHDPGWRNLDDIIIVSVLITEHPINREGENKVKHSISNNKQERNGDNKCNNTEKLLSSNITHRKSALGSYSNIFCQTHYNNTHSQSTFTFQVHPCIAITAIHQLHPGIIYIGSTQSNCIII